eukprot:1210640-Pleurochrysis_carterae.AAC.1
MGSGRLIRRYLKLNGTSPCKYRILKHVRVIITMRSKRLPYSSSAIPHAAGGAPAQQSVARADFAGTLARSDCQK